MEQDVWFYKDPLGMVQGPFKSLNMDLWNLDGYFNPMLMISWLQNKQFVTIDHFKANPASLYKLAMIYVPYPIKFDLEEFEEYKRKESQGNEPIKSNSTQINHIQNTNSIASQQYQNVEMHSLYDFMKSNNIQTQGNTQPIFTGVGNIIPSKHERLDGHQSKSQKEFNFNAELQLNLLAQRFPDLLVQPEISNKFEVKRKTSQTKSKGGQSSSKGIQKEIGMKNKSLTASELKMMLGIKSKPQVEEEEVYVPKIRQDTALNGEDLPPLH